jgi:hypothetical protein
MSEPAAFGNDPETYDDDLLMYISVVNARPWPTLDCGSS